jgi:hypothetical protein
MATTNQAVKIAIIGAAGIILAAIVGAVLQPSWWQREPSGVPRTSSTIAGTVVDGTTNQDVGQATISIVGRAEKYVSEDNGNFRIDLQPSIPANAQVRIHVEKQGYMPYDGTTTPTETLIIQLKKM